MVGPKESDVTKWGSGAYSYANSGCAWCHPGGAGLEMDRDGYRFDGKPSEYASNDGGTYGAKTGQNSDAANQPGEYYEFSSASGALVSRTADWVSRGVWEADCMMCHFAGRFNNQARNLGTSTPGPKMGPTLGLSDDAADTFTDGGLELVTIPEAGDGTNMTSITGWTYKATTIPATSIVAVPEKENCAICHFADGNFATGGPGASALGNTAFQKIDSVVVDSDTGAANSFGRATATPLGTAMKTAKGRVELGKRAELMNGSNANFDVHMKNGGLAGTGMECSACHSLATGDFEATVTDHKVCSNDSTGGTVAAGYECTSSSQCGTGTCDYQVIQAGLTGVGKMDHQITHGHNLPDSKNMDILDNTVTCAMCHITMDHDNVCETAPGSGLYKMKVWTYNAAPVADTFTCTGKDVPRPSHDGLPSFHLDKIDCRTCHIPVAPGPQKLLVQDFATGPYPFDGGIERGLSATSASDTTGVWFKTITDKNGLNPIKGYMPLLIWQPSSYFETDLQINPVGTILGLQWYGTNGYYPKRFSNTAAMMFRNDIQDGAYNGNSTTTAPYGPNTMPAYDPATGSGGWSWKLNSAQAGDTALNVNTTTEIAGMVDIIENKLPAHSKWAGVGMKFTFGFFNISHNVLPKTYALGAKGCADCHSATGDIFNRTHTLFKQPTDGGKVAMTCDGGNCSTGTKRVSGSSTFATPNGSYTADLVAGKNHNDAVTNTLSQATVLGYNSIKAAELSWKKSPLSAVVTIPDVDLPATTHCVDLDRDNNCDDLDGVAGGDNLPIPSNTTINPRVSATASYKKDAAGNPVPDVDLGINLDASRSICANAPCEYSWAITDINGAAASATFSNCVETDTPADGCQNEKSATAVVTAAGTYFVTVTMTDADNNVATKKIAAFAEKADSTPSITGSAAVAGSCTAAVTVTASNASTLLVNCGNGSDLVTAVFVGGSATATCTYTNGVDCGNGAEVAIIATAKDTDNDSDTVTVDGEFNPMP